MRGWPATSNSSSMIRSRWNLEKPLFKSYDGGSQSITSRPGSSNRSSFCPQRNPRTFPHFSYPPASHVDWTNAKDVTNHTFTSFEIVNPKEYYHICDEVELRIHARNGRNESKQYGGDYFRAKIFTKYKNKFSASSSTDGEVVDHRNGTYSAFFTLKWTGKVGFRVILMHSSEVVHVLNDLREKHQPHTSGFKGEFRSSKGKSANMSYCNYQLRKSMVGCCCCCLI